MKNKLNDPIGLVFLHGFMADARIWRDFAFRFSKSFSVFCADLPGHGTRPIFLDNPSMEGYAENVSASLPPDKRYVFIGHSMGGYVALAFATLFPDRVAGIVLMNSTCFADSDARKVDRDRSIAVMRKNYSLFARSFVPSLFADADNAQMESVLSIALQQDPRGMIQSTLAMRNRMNRCDEQVGRNVPVLLVAGRNDKLIPAEPINLFKHICPDADVVWFENSGHLAFVEEADRCAEVLSDWLLSKGFITA